MKREVFEAAYGRAVSRETFERLSGFVDQVLKWQKSINLIAPSTVPMIWERHVLDSVVLLHQVRTPRQWIDIGSGGGFPGLILAILGAEQFPNCRFHLVESNGKKAAFLQESARLFASNALVHQARAESFLEENNRFDIVSARALAPLLDLVDWTQPLLIRGGMGLFMKGQEVQSETEVAKAAFSFQFAIRSKHDSRDGSIAAVWQDGETHPLLSDANGWTRV
jgi:16S rRNA (guanine527-N7)-methyltransferase